MQVISPKVVGSRSRRFASRDDLYAYLDSLEVCVNSKNNLFAIPLDKLWRFVTSTISIENRGGYTRSGNINTSRNGP